MKTKRTNRHFFAGTLFVILLAAHASIYAEGVIRFNVVENEKGNRHISMIPEPGYTEDGRVKDSYNPNSIIYQHARMLEALKNEHRELTRQSIEEEAAVTDDDISTSEPTPGNIFSEVNTNTGKSALEKLIDLEKRGGRTAPVETDTP